MSVIAEKMEGIKWDGTAIGMGVRGADIPEVVGRFEGNQPTAK